MSFDLNELRAQRDKVREHLNWLDRQIEQLEGAKPATTPTEADQANTPQPLPPSVAQSPTPDTGKPTSEKAAEPASTESKPEIMMDFTPGGFDGASKAGCILAGVAAAGLILFLLFGLPYLL
ncbi:hypothetical protein [Cerasicoccus frondis]|uniref:hypothetical protein n=1 Tax=Cerasicoccus frondis TaxID=490090 RepID=UPI00285273AB|nr:hypothetical protein [Cerasicoccus frondis]